MKGNVTITINEKIELSQFFKQSETRLENFRRNLIALGKVFKNKSYRVEKMQP